MAVGASNSRIVLVREEVRTVDGNKNLKKAQKTFGEYIQVPCGVMNQRSYGFQSLVCLGYNQFERGIRTC